MILDKSSLKPCHICLKFYHQPLSVSKSMLFLTPFTTGVSVSHLHLPVSVYSNPELPLLPAHTYTCQINRCTTLMQACQSLQWVQTTYKAILEPFIPWAFKQHNCILHLRYCNIRI